MYSVISPPDSLPITVAEVRRALNIAHSEWDTNINERIAEAVDAAQNRAHCSLMLQIVRARMNAFPGQLTGATAPIPVVGVPRNAIVLEYGPVRSITAIQYLDMSATVQTMPAGDYTLAALPGNIWAITPKFGKIWPIPLPQVGSVWIDFVAGFDDADMVPAAVKTWLKAYVGALLSMPALHSSSPFTVNRVDMPQEFQNNLLAGVRSALI